jgi:AcrR family transcriptional regulator
MSQLPALERTHAHDARGRDLVIKTASELLIDSGLRAITLDAVAARAHISKSTISRWWPSEQALAIDVLHREWTALAASVRRGAIKYGL